MSEPLGYLWLIPALPFAAAAVTPVLGKVLKENSHWPCVVGAGLACLISVWVFALVVFALPDGKAAYGCWQDVTWFQAGNVNVTAGLRADSLTAMMLVTVTFIGTLIAIYSSGYMHGDEGYARYFAFVSLFLFSMTGLVLADNYILLYAFWEGVGLCSYMLIGFWFFKPSAAAAARKAFLVTRLGDVGLFLGILLLWAGLQANPAAPANPAGAGPAMYSLDFVHVFEGLKGQNETLVTVICLLLFCGAVGKSAQFPLHVWLPDAMEGPSPVSALIHAATMVTAGVYLVARSTPLFILSPTAQVTVAVTGGITALLAALIALTQTDLKRVLAYSTVSQLGYMFMALGCVGVMGHAANGEAEGVVSPGVFPAVFHLFTHAFFKALLFLAAGSVMHAMGNVIDMRRFGGLRGVLPVTHRTFLAGALALAGVPPFAGFWSKDQILDSLWTAGHHSDEYRGVYMTLLAVGFLTAGLTAFYTFRAYFMTFWGEERIPPEAGHHAHESPPVMTIPLAILAVGAIGIGVLVQFPFAPFLSGFIGRTEWLHVEQPEFGLTTLVMMGMSTAVATGGIGVAYLMYVVSPGLAAGLEKSAQPLYQLSLNKFHIDELYDAFIVQPLNGLADFCREFDRNVVDELVNLIAQLPVWLGALFRPLQNGLIQFYALSMSLSVVVLLGAMLLAAWK